MFGAEWVHFMPIVLVSLVLFPPSTIEGFGFNPMQCFIDYKLHDSSIGDSLYGHLSGNLSVLNAEDCKNLKKVDRYCVPRWLKFMSPFRTRKVEKKCAEYGPDH